MITLLVIVVVVHPDRPVGGLDTEARECPEDRGRRGGPGLKRAPGAKLQGRALPRRGIL